MPSRGQVAKQVRENRERSPEAYCSRCLWNLASGPCPKHGVQSAVTVERCPQCTLDVSGGQDHHEGCMYFQ
jgi:hypothetical protein